MQANNPPIDLVLNEDNLLVNVKRYFADAIRYLRLDKEISDMLERPEREVEVNFPVIMENGTVKVFTGYRKPEGLSVADLHSYLDSSPSGTLAGYHEKGCSRIPCDELLALDVNVLVPAAMENQINVQNAARVKAKLVVEGANGPVTSAADMVLREKGVEVVPDILANAGGVVVSYLEWTQNLRGQRFTREDVLQRLDLRMQNSLLNLLEVKKACGLSLRTAGYVLAVKRVVDTLSMRGRIPHKALLLV